MAIRSPNVQGLLQSLGQLQQANALLAQREAQEIARKQAEESQTLRSVGTVAGAVIGGYVTASPQGAMAGAAIGGAAGGALAGDVQASEVVGAGTAAYQYQQIGQKQTLNEAITARATQNLQPQIAAGQQAQQAQVDTSGLDMSPEFKQDLSATIQQGQESQKKIGLLQSLGQSGASPQQVASVAQILLPPKNLTPSESQQAGFSPGTVVQENQVTGERRVIAKPTTAQPKYLTIYDKSGKPIDTTADPLKAAAIQESNPGSTITRVGAQAGPTGKAIARGIQKGEDLELLADKPIEVSTSQNIIRATNSNSPFVQIGVRDAQRREVSRGNLEGLAGTKRFAKAFERENTRLETLKAFDEGFLASSGALPDETEQRSAAGFRNPSDARVQGANSGSRITIRNLQDRISESEKDPADIGREPSLTVMRDAADKARLIGTERGDQYAKSLDKRIDSKIKRIEKKSVNPVEAVKIAKSLRKDLVSENKNRTTILDSSDRLLAVASQDSPAADLAFIFNFMKMQDPGSVVRESEFATAEATASMWERAKVKLQKVTAGKRLSSAQKQDFLNQAANIRKITETRVSRLNNFYSNIAQSAGIDPALVVQEGVDLGGNAINNKFFRLDESGTPIFDQEGIIQFRRGSSGTSSRSRLRAAGSR